MSEPTQEEYKLIAEFRIKVKDILTSAEQRSDQFLIRWIRARNGDLQKAEVMLRDATKWRKENEMDEALSKELHPFILNNFPFWIDSTDKFGRPVIELPIGLWDVRTAMDTPENERNFGHFINYLFEVVVDKIRLRQGNNDGKTWPVTQVLGIWNWTGYSYAQFLHKKGIKTISNILRMCSVYEAYYPEILFKIICVNCPVFFPVLFGMAKHLVDIKTLSKIEMYGKNREQWEPMVRSFVDPEAIGIEFGGSRFYRLTDKNV